MSQNDFNLANQGFPSMRADMNSALQALASTSAGATEPATMYAYQLWYDETADLLRMRNGVNDAWITLASFDQAANEWEIRSAIVQAVDAAGVSIKTDDGITRLRVTDSGNVGVATETPLATLDVGGTGALKVPVGTDAQRPTPATGLLRFNSTSLAFEGYDGAEWAGFGGGGSVTLTEFTSSGTYTKPADANFIYVECWAGGGSGGRAVRNSTARVGTGGAGGQFSWRMFLASDVPSTVTVTVGAGGTASSDSANGFAGGNSSFGTLVTATGGGGGGGASASALPLPLVQGGSCGYYGGASLADRASGGVAAGNGGGTANGNAGGNAVYGGGGGGSATSTIFAGGVSVFGGNGGVGGASGTAGDGSIPAGGGGGVTSTSAPATSGAGARGEVRVFSF